MEPRDLSRVTPATLDVLTVLIEASDDPHGFAVAKAAQHPTGSVYPILIRLEEAGWVESYWETAHPDENRPRRRFYRLTRPEGLRAARTLLADYEVSDVNNDARHSHRKEPNMATTTQLGSVTPFISPNTSLNNAFDDYLGDFAADFDIDGLIDAYREEINKNLADTTIRIHGDEIYADYPPPADWFGLVRQAFEAVDTEALARQFDTTAY